MVVIIGVTGIALVAVALAATISTRNARLSRERATARNLAFEVIELAKTERNADPAAFFSSGTRTENLASVGTNPVYDRTVTYTEEIPDQKMRILVVIAWEDAGRDLSVTEETSLERYTGN